MKIINYKIINNDKKINNYALSYLILSYSKIISSYVLNNSKIIKNYSNLTNNINCILNVKLLYSNIIINLTDLKGNISFTTSSGLFGLKGFEKTNKYAILSIIKYLFYKLKSVEQVYKVSVHFKGLNKSFNKLVIKHLKKFISIKAIKYYNLIPHNGCKPKKMKRVKNKK